MNALFQKKKKVNEVIFFLFEINLVYQPPTQQVTFHFVAHV